MKASTNEIVGSRRNKKEKQVAQHAAAILKSHRQHNWEATAAVAVDDLDPDPHSHRSETVQLAATGPVKVVRGRWPLFLTNGIYVPDYSRRAFPDTRLIAVDTDRMQLRNPQGGDVVTVPSQSIAWITEFGDRIDVLNDAAGRFELDELDELDAVLGAMASHYQDHNQDMVQVEHLYLPGYQH